MTPEKKWPERPFTIESGTNSPTMIIVKGRTRWALEALMSAGAKGCTPIINPAPRWSAYIFKLRKLGVCIETIHEAHDGPFAGHHARYVLRSSVTPGRRAA